MIWIESALGWRYYFYQGRQILAPGRGNAAQARDLCRYGWSGGCRDWLRSPGDGVQPANSVRLAVYCRFERLRRCRDRDANRQSEPLLACVRTLRLEPGASLKPRWMGRCRGGRQALQRCSHWCPPIGHESVAVPATAVSQSWRVSDSIRAHCAHWNQAAWRGNRTSCAADDERLSSPVAASRAGFSGYRQSRPGRQRGAQAALD